MRWSYAENFKCDDCARLYSLNSTKITTCPNCGHFLEVVYDLSNLKKNVNKNMFKKEAKGIWRWHHFFPLQSKENIVTLGEGDSPLVQSKFLSKKLGLNNLYFKNDTLMPTGSFKDRGFSLAISFAKEQGINEGITYSSGNAGLSFSTYSKRAGIKSLTLVEYLANDFKKSLIKRTGSDLLSLKYQNMLEINKLLDQISSNGKLYQFVNFINPVRHEAMKTYAYEISEGLNWSSPDYMVHPIGTGGGLWGTWKGFNELKELDWISSKPKMVGVQPVETSPHVYAFKNGKRIVTKRGDSNKTIAQSISANGPLKDGARILKALGDSEGYGVSVSNSEITSAMKELAEEGIIAEPASAATIAALYKLVKTYKISSEATIVCVITGTGFKQPSLINNEELKIEEIYSEYSEFLSFIKEKWGMNL